MKKCNKCFCLKDESNYHKDKNKKDGLSTICKKCRAFATRIYTLNSKEKRSKYKKEYYSKNKETILKKMSEDKDYLLKKKIYRENNKAKIREYQQKWYKENIDHILRYNKNHVNCKKQNDPMFKFVSDIRKNFAINLKRCINKKTKSFFSYTGIQTKIYLEYFKNDPLWNNYCNNENIHIDHIIPVSAYDFTDENEIKKCWQPENLRFLFAKDNIEKSNKIDFDVIKNYKIQHLLPKGLLCL